MIVSVYPPLERGILFGAKPDRLEFPMTDERCVLTHLGRGAVWLALKALGVPKRVAMPAFHCGSEVEAARALGIKIEFYRVSSDLEVDVDHMTEVARGCDALYLISNFGFPTPYEEARSAGKIVIEDVAHGLFSSSPSGRPLGNGADAAIFCPRKSLGVPDGGALVVSGDIDQPELRAQSRRALASLILNRAALSGFAPISAVAGAVLERVSATGRAAEAGTMTETVIGEWNLTEADLRAAAAEPSRLTGRALRRADAAAIRERRRENFVAAAEVLADLVQPAYRALPDGTCPLYVPIRVKRRDAVMKGLWGRGVRAIEIWPVAHPLLEGYEDLRQVRSELIALPVHQALSVERAVEAAKIAASVVSSETE
ncbi:MAG: hypothetical protein DCC49_02345 [Acidobacteria bacterium]|nr:MAG: hypothetical protein DCC49_02345 [Acidobacteriota bacterium]